MGELMGTLEHVRVYKEMPRVYSKQEGVDCNK